MSTSAEAVTWAPRFSAVNPAWPLDFVHVYGLRNRAGQLLYAGVSKRLNQRLREHSVKWWWPQVDHAVAVPYGTKRDALDAERLLHWLRDPVHSPSCDRLRPRADWPHPVGPVVLICRCQVSEVKR